MPSSYMSQAVSAVRCGVYRPYSLIPKKYFSTIRQIDWFRAYPPLELDQQVTVSLRNKVRLRALTF
jgi:hypothetical protein